MREINKISEALFEKIRSRFEDVSLGNDKAQATSDPEQARFFNFDFTVGDENCGNVTLSLADELTLKIYYSKNMSQDLSQESKEAWEGFLRELRHFSKRNLLGFEPRDITRSLKLKDLKQASHNDNTYSKDDIALGESRMYGTSKSSYQKFGPVKIIVRHSKPVTDEQRGSRARNINSIFVENDQGERFRMPFRRLSDARAMARHISAGGTVNDDLGKHICEMAEECNKLRPFLRNVRHRTFEDTQTQDMIEAAFQYHGLLRHTLNKMKGKKGYIDCKEQFSATSTSFIPEDAKELDEIKDRFTKRVMDEKVAEALPIVQKAYEMKKDNKWASKFETWAQQVSEGTWALPETEEDKKHLIDLMSEKLPVGVDAQNATNALYNIFGDDRLFDELEELANNDPEADAREVIMNHLMEKNPEMYQAILTDIGDQEPHEPAEPASEANTYGTTGMDEPVVETQEHDEDEEAPTFNSIKRRILLQHSDLLGKYGPEAILQAIRDEAERVGEVDEIGSSDVSAWVNNVCRELESGSYDHLVEGWKSVAAGAALAAGMAGNAFLDQQTYNASPQLKQLEQYHTQALQAGDKAKAKELERRIEDHKTRLSLGKGDVLDSHGEPKQVTYEGIQDIKRLAGLK
jgi:hypothetical protein